MTPTHVVRHVDKTGPVWLERFGMAIRLSDRLQLLTEFELTDADIAKAAGTSVRTLRRWRTEGTPTTKVAERWEPIDDLCTVIRYFIADGSYDVVRILAWLRTRNSLLNHRRPLEMLGEGGFAVVLEAAENAVKPRGIAAQDSFFLTHAGHQTGAPEAVTERSAQRRRTTPDI